jgi:DNA repair exonuclease SbcCD ATPase subunit
MNATEIKQNLEQVTADLEQAKQELPGLHQALLQRQADYAQTVGQNIDARVKAMSKVEGVKSLISRYEQDIENLTAERAELERKYHALDGFDIAIVECEKLQQLAGERAVIQEKIKSFLIENFNELAKIRLEWYAANSALTENAKRALEAKGGDPYNSNQLNAMLREIHIAVGFAPSSAGSFDVLPLTLEKEIKRLANEAQATQRGAN